MTRAAEPDQPEDFSGGETEGDRSDMTRGQILDFEHRLTGRGLRRRRLLLKFPADDRVYERTGRGLAHRACRHFAAVPQDRHAIGDAKHLIETVGHVDDSDPILLHAMKYAEETGYVRTREAPPWAHREREGRYGPRTLAQSRQSTSPPR